MGKKFVKMHVMSIVHGKSEFIMCHSIKSNLRIKHYIHAKNKGRHSIQVNSVMNELNSSVFSGGLKKFAEKYDIEYDSKLKKLVKFKLFIIMDVDDCSEEQAEKFKDKSMFKKHYLCDYIVPIYNDPDLEKTMFDAGISVNKSNKSAEYIKIFPTSKGDLDMNIAKEFANKLQKCKSSNLYEYFDYCISVVENS